MGRSSVPEVLFRARGLLRAALPLELRIALRRAPAIARDLLLPTPIERAADRAAFPHVQCARATPLRRGTVHYGEQLQQGKERNVALGAALIDGAVVAPGAIFSWHRAVGPPLRLRGFTRGPELHEGVLEPGLGGGLCQVSNLLYWLALHAGMEIVERHRHELDLFPDHDRTAPFGCGATVYYPRRDLRFRNPLEQPLLLETWLEAGQLHGRARLPCDPGMRWEVSEAGHRFVRSGAGVFRENRLLRRRIGPGTAVAEELVSQNRARAAYPVPESQIETGREE